MKKIGNLAVLAILFVVLLPGMASAQASVTGILTGTVVEEQGQPLPGVEVTISSPALMSPRLVPRHTEKGAFRFTFLPPGIYTLSATLSGFGTYKTENISVLLNMTTEFEGHDAGRQARVRGCRRQRRPRSSPWRIPSWRRTSTRRN